MQTAHTCTPHIHITHSQTPTHLLTSPPFSNPLERSLPFPPPFFFSGSFHCDTREDSSCSCNAISSACDVCTRHVAVEQEAGAAMLHHRAVPSDYTAYNALYPTPTKTREAVQVCAAACLNSEDGRCIAFTMGRQSGGGFVCSLVSWYDRAGVAVPSPLDFYALPQCSQCSAGYEIDRLTCTGV